MADRGSNYSSYRPDIWTAQVNRFFGAKLVMANFFWNFSRDVASGGKTVIIPDIAGEPAAKTFVTSTGAVTANVILDTVIRMDIDQWKYAARMITPFQEAQIAGQYGALDFYQEDMGYSLAKDLDSALINDCRGLTLSVGTSSSNINASDIEGAMRVAGTNNIPTEDMRFLFQPKAFWAGPMQYQKYYDHSMFGQHAALEQGTHAVLYGVPVTLTTQIPTDQVAGQRASGYSNLLVHKTAMAFAIGGIPGMSVQGPAVEVLKSGDNIRKTIVAHLMYGKKLANTDRGIRIKCTTGVA